MKISICFPQYNRIAYLLKSLNLISKQSYDNIEIIISDDDEKQHIYILYTDGLVVRTNGE